MSGGLSLRYNRAKVDGPAHGLYGTRDGTNISTLLSEMLSGSAHF